MRTLAAVLVETGKPLRIDEIEIPRLKPGQVLVEVVLSGVCHTQVLECRGYRGEDRYLPHCLGHEGSGIVREISPGVSKVKPGDRVILSWMKGTGGDVPGTVYQWNGRSVNAGGITTFSQYSVISENRLTVVPETLSMRDAAMIGCAAATGLGSVFNVAQAKPGQSIAIFGSGGIGLCAVAAAVIAGCTPVIAVDVVAQKLELAARMGAGHCLDAKAVNVLEEIRGIVPGGLDLAVESSGRPEVMLQALDNVRSQGGIAVVVGNARFGERLSLDPMQLNQGKQLRGTWGGDNAPDSDFPRYARLITSGKLDLSPLMERTYSLVQVNEALNDLESGVVARPLIDMKAGFA